MLHRCQVGERGRQRWASPDDDARHALEQDVAAGEEPDQRLLDDVVVPDDLLRDLRLELGELGLEAVDPFGLASVHVVPDLDESRFVITPTFHGERQRLTFRVTLGDPETRASISRPALNGVPFAVDVPDPQPWVLSPTRVCHSCLPSRSNLTTPVLPKKQ